MSYKEIIQEIINLPWERAKPEDIIFLSRCTAVEFAESLRLAKKLYSDDERLKLMMEGELETDNMSYGDYSTSGDHWEFLDYFVKKFGLEYSSSKVKDAADEYTRNLQTMSDEDRVMTVFSREEELTNIFRKIIDSHDWEGLGYGFYKHYLESHIIFDSGEEGHHYLTKHFPLHDEVLNKFYEVRLKLYKSLF